MTCIATASALTPGVAYSIGQHGRSVFISNGRPDRNTDVQMWTDTDVPAQRWVLEQSDTDPRQYALRNLFSGLYLNYNGTIAGAKIRQADRSVFLSYWTLEEDGDSYVLVPSQNAAMCLAAASTDEGAALSLQERSTADAGLTRFTLRQDDVPEAFGEAVRDDFMSGFLGQYYHKASTGHVLGGGGWWGDAEMFEVILDAFATTGDLKYKEIFDELVIDFCRRNGRDWSNNEFNDDITWMVLACARAYKYFGTQEYLDLAKDNYTRMYNRAHQRFGTLIWKQSQENKIATNSCINCPATVAACMLGELTGDNSWYDKALTIYAGQRKLLYNAETGEVWDSGAWTADGEREPGANHWVSTYNQGTMLGAATLLYLYTKDPMYLEDAKKVYERSRDHLTNNNKIISVCQTVNGDLCGFKGILMRYVRTYAETFHLEEPLQWMEKNAWHAWQNRNSGGVIWSAWLTKTAESLTRKEGDDEKDVTNDAFGASTAVSVAFNAHVNRRFAKSVSEGLQPEYFDDIKFAQLTEDSSEGRVTTPALSGGWICFRNVDFGQDGISSLDLRLKATKARSFVQVYVDELTDDGLMGRNSGFLTRGDWSDVVVPFKSGVTGVHDVYIRFSGEGVQVGGIKSTGSSSGVDSPEAVIGEIGSVYNLRGIRVGSSMDGLAPGIYISGGHKILKR